MKGCYFLEKNKLELRETQTPTPGPEEALVRVAACGVCGTDIHIYHGEEGSAKVAPPVVLGHEFSGVVEQVGAGVTGLKPGDHVTIDPNIYCGHCHFCRIGKKQLCENLRAVGVNQNGGFADYCLCPASQCFLLSDEIPLEAGAMTEPLACCIHGIDRARIRTGDTVCVIGGGAIGLLMVQLARLAGASYVILSEPVQMRRDIALRVGADAAIDPMREDLCARIKEITGTEGVDVVIECVGRLQATQQSFEAAKRGATILLFSVPTPDAVFQLPLFAVFQKELTVLGSFVNPDTHLRAAELINTGKIKIAPLITHRFPVEQTEAAIKMQMSSESLKVVVTP